MLVEFAAGWRLAGRSPHTLVSDTRALTTLVRSEGDVDAWHLALIRGWPAGALSRQTARMRASAVRAALRWASAEELPDAAWWRCVPVAQRGRDPSGHGPCRS